MSKYGVSVYGGTTKYGPGQSGGFSASYFEAVSENYGAIRLLWSKPNGEWNRFTIIRNSYGFPVDTDDGEVVFENTDGSAMSLPDTKISQGREYYYAIFVRSLDGVWHLSATAIGLSVKDFGTYNLMWLSLPLALRSRTRNILDASNENKDLSDFIRILAFETDRLKTYAFLIRYTARPEFIPRVLLPLLVRQFGLEYEPAIGDKQVRSLVNNAIRLYQEKGSYTGLLSYIKYFSGYDSRLETGKNLFLDYITSSFEENPPALPTVAGAALEVVLYDGVTPITPMPFTVTTDGVASRGSGYLKVTSNGVEPNIVIPLNYGTEERLFGIPVQGGGNYTFSAYSRAATTVRNITAIIDWYDVYGTYISTSTGSAVANSTSAWQRVSKSAAAPAKAARAVLKLKIASAANGEIHYIDAAQMEAGNTATTFEDARLIKIVLLPSRINHLLNPNFTTTASHWNLTNYSSYEIVDSADVNPHSVLSGTALEVYPSTTADVKISSDEMANLVPNEYYTFSTYFSVGSYGTDNTTIDSARASIVWLNSSHAQISESIGEPLSIVRNLKSGWESSSSILQKDYVGIESDTLKFKVGDGVTPWNLLPYASDSITYVYKSSGSWTGSEVLGIGHIGVETNTYKFKVGDGVTNWATLNYTTSLPAWCRPSVTAKCPANAVYARARLSWSPDNTSMAVIVDEALFEKAPSVDAFFDGDIGVEDASALSWEGTPHASRSFYYRNKNAVVSRLESTIPNYLTFGSTFGIYYAAQ